MIQDIATVFWRDWIVLRHRLLKFILSRMVAPVLYMVAFGWGLARSVNTGGGSYLDFIVPGILALNSMNIAFNSLTPLCTERVYHKSLEEYLLAPISASGFYNWQNFGGSAARAYFVVNYCSAGMAFWRKTCPYAFVYSCFGVKLRNFCRSRLLRSPYSTQF